MSQLILVDSFFLIKNEMAQIIFRLIGNRQPQSWTLPISGATAIKPGTKQSKLINYYKGNDSIFTEDILAQNKEIKPSKIPAFYKNDITGKTELKVNETDTNLILLLKSHSWFGKKYEIYSLEKESENALAEYDLKLKAAGLVNELDDLELRSKAMVVFGIHAMQWQTSVANHKLKELAFNDPKKVISKLESIDFESQYIAAKAYIEGVVRNNSGQTKVIWADTEETIINLAVGELGNIKLGEFLNSNSDQSLSTMQAIAQKLGIGTQQEEQTPVNTISEKELRAKDAKLAELEIESASKLQAKDDEIAQLKAQLEAANKGSVQEINTPSTQTETANKAEMTLEEAQAKYFEKYQKEPGPAHKNNLEWLKSKL